MPGHYPHLPGNNEDQLELLVADLFREHGWKIIQQPREKDLAADLVASRPGKKLIIEIKRASEGRRDRVIPLLSQAALEAAYSSRNFPGNPIPVAIVGANHILESVAEQAQKFIRERVPDVAVGLLDFQGFRSFAGHGLEVLNSVRSVAESPMSPKLQQRAPQLFSDLNQWMLKVLLAPAIPESYLSAPRAHYRGASQLADAAKVSVMSAFRFVEQFSKAGFLEQSSGLLRIVRSNELVKRWQAASQQRVLEVPMRWILHKGKGALENALRSWGADEFPSSRPRACLGLFSSAEALGLGFVHGVEPHLYLERMSGDVGERLGLSGAEPQRAPDVYVRIPGNRESVFRGAVVKNGVPVSDVVQVWLDVSQHPARGREQADLIWRRVLARAFEGES
jgi:restriction endonuclease